MTDIIVAVFIAALMLACFSGDGHKDRRPFDGEAYIDADFEPVAEDEAPETGRERKET